jgi:hypothetical protein
MQHDIIDKHHRLTCKVRWEQLDEDLPYAPNELDSRGRSSDQIRIVIPSRLRQKNDCVMSTH